MRPLCLELTGFRSWDRARVDFGGGEVVVVLGDTGAGKSSLLDAISFALYARTPEETRSGRLLRSGSDHGEVRLTFAAGAGIWRVSRRFGPAAPEPAHLLEEIADDGTVAQIAAGEAAVSERVARLLGMGFPAFGSAVLLAQGRFAEFLVAPPRRRDDVLREIFGVAPLEAARETASGAAAHHEGEAEALARGAEVPRDATSATRAAARAAREAAAGLSRLRLSLPRLERADALRAEADERGRRAEELAQALALVPPAPERERIAAAALAARQAAEAAESALVAARGEAETAMAALGAGRERLGGDGAELARLAETARAFESAREEIPSRERAAETARGALGEARHAAVMAAEALEGAEAATRADQARQAARDAVAAARDVRERAEATLASARASAVIAADRAAAAGEALREAEARRDDARAAHAAAHLRDGLIPGDDCPVCGGVVGIIGGLASPDASKVDGAVRAARRVAREADREAAAAEAGRVSAEKRSAEALAALAEAEKALAEAPGAAGPVGDDELARARRRGEETARALGRAESEARAREDELTRVREDQTSRREQLGGRAGADDPLVQILAAGDEMAALEERGHVAAGALQDAVARAEAARGEERRVAEGELAEMARALAAVARLLDGEHDLEPDEIVARGEQALAAARAAATRAAAEAEHHREEAAAPTDLSDPARRAAALERARGRLAEAEAAYAALRAELRRARDAAIAAAAARATAARHRQVAEDLKANRFPRFVLERHRRRLAEGASLWLRDLTGGDLRFAGDEPDPLAVIDRRYPDAPRAASTLSGGERFLASLALALGLGEVAAEGGGRPDCLFVDEGFAALDADALDQALTAIERVAGDDRLVVVITHLAGVAERLGGALRVEKDAGGTSRLASAAPAPAAARLVRAT